jgi:hypothetical protein
MLRPKFSDLLIFRNYCSGYLFSLGLCHSVICMFRRTFSILNEVLESCELVILCLNNYEPQVLSSQSIWKDYKKENVCAGP